MALACLPASPCLGTRDAADNSGQSMKDMAFLDHKIDDDLYTRAMKSIYFPFLLRFHRYGLLLWFATFVIAIVFGPQFLGLTRSDLDLPPGTSSNTAMKALTENYPEISTQPPAFIIAQSDDGSRIMNQNTKRLNADLDLFVSSYPDIISTKSGYYDYINNRNLSFLAPQVVSSDNQTMVFTINFKADASLDKVSKVVEKLQKFAAAQSYSGTKVGCTGLEALFNDLAAGSIIAFELIDSVVLPISLVILGYNLKSYRHIIVAMVNLGCTLLLALAILVPIAKIEKINPFAPSILLTLGIAVCFDYSLFMLSRYREEIMVNKLEKEEAVFVALLESGHVVLLSGFTLLVTFLLLIAFPQNFLQSVGYGCSTVIFTAVLSNMTVTPCLLLTFDCLTKFDLFPSVPEFCKCLCCKSDEIPKPDSVDTKTNQYNTEGQRIGNDAALEEVLVSSSRHSNVMEDKQICQNEAGGEETKKGSKDPRSTRRAWFHVAFFAANHPYATLLIALAITIPLAIEWSNLKATSDNNVVFLRNSDSLDYLHILSTAFPIGAIEPYKIVCVTGVPDGVNTENYFKAESNMIKVLLESQDNYMNAGSIIALSFFNGEYVDFKTSQTYLKRTSPVYDSVAASRYRTLAGSLRNAAMSASIVEITTIADPVGEVIVPFILDTRKILLDPAVTNFVPNFTLSPYLYGGYCSTYDIQVIMYSLYPVMIASTIAVVIFIIGVSFGSALLPIRLLLTVAISLCWTYGLMVLVYQPGPGRDAFIKLNPVLSTSSGVYFLIPIMSFSVLVGLALDYDIFLMYRVLEFRQMGWSDRASVCLGVEKTGGVITAAGLIMSISFAGLLIPETTVLNQFGFVLFIGVAIDTFIVRTFIVPAAVTAFSLSSCSLSGAWSPFSNRGSEVPLDGKDKIAYLSSAPPDDGEVKSMWRIKDADMNWWPAMVPRVVLPPSGEDAALLAGYDNPNDYIMDQLAKSEIDEVRAGSERTTC